jgi:hypothetical protein
VPSNEMQRPLGQPLEIHVGLYCSVALRPFPELSTVVAPEPSSKAQ